MAEVMLGEMYSGPNRNVGYVLVHSSLSLSNTFVQIGIGYGAHELRCQTMCQTMCYLPANGNPQLATGPQKC
jgi:hypothetical protein